MSAKHSKGPWTFKTVNKTNVDGVNVSFSVDGADRLEICSGQSQEHLQSSRAINEDECRANARLISAAPDLLEALEAVAGAWGNLPFRSPIGLKQQIDAAISKARGQS